MTDISFVSGLPSGDPQTWDKLDLYIISTASNHVFFINTTYVRCLHHSLDFLLHF